MLRTLLFIAYWGNIESFNIRAILRRCPEGTKWAAHSVHPVDLQLVAGHLDYSNKLFSDPAKARLTLTSNFGAISLVESLKSNVH